MPIMKNSKFQYLFIANALNIGIWNLENFGTYTCLGKALLLKTKSTPTPVEIATSATLKIALKKAKCFPPNIGSQAGRFPSQIGK